MMLYLELFTELGDHCVAEIRTIASNNSLLHTVSTYQIMSDKPRHDVLGYCSKRAYLNPLREVINSHKNETMPGRRSRSDPAYNVDAPHCKGPQSCQDVQGDQRHMHFISIDLALMKSSGVLITICFYSGPVVYYS